MLHNSTDPNIQIDLDGDIPRYAKGYARAKINDIVRFAPKRVLFVRLRLAPTGPHGHPDVVAHANLDVNGTPVITHAVGTTAHEAIDLLQAKLRIRLERM